MISKYIARSISMMLIIGTAFSLTAQSHWTIMNSDNITEYQYGERQVVPTDYVVSYVDMPYLKKSLNKAPLDSRSNSVKAGSITLPMPDGTIESFKVWYSPVMHPDLAAKYPAIKTYRIIGEDNDASYGRVGISKDGFHAIVDSPDGEVYIDTYADETTEVYVSYYTRNQDEPAGFQESSCGTKFDASELKDLIDHDQTTYRGGEQVFLKKYRTAIACTGEWGDNFNSVESVLAAIVVGANRVNQTMENEASVFFELVANNDELIFRDPATDPYTINPNTGEGAHPGGQVLGQNSTVINSIIGANSYDIGHCFTRSCTDGIAGVASFGSVCGNNKAAGISCVGNSNVSSFMVGVAIHEFGHQFGASHTWGNCTEGVLDQFSSGTALEPGSGSTHMSYAGTCGQNNVAGTNDDYFHVGSLIQMYNLISIGNGSQCGEDILTDNISPEITLPYEDGFSIPVFTPFRLEGSATDQNDDNLTYTWEQFNTGPMSTLGTPLGNAPAFRSFPPRDDNFRVFPSMFKILANTSDNSEKLQIEGRRYNFMLTVRDNFPGSGIAEWEEVEFFSETSAGPFFLMSPNNNEQLEVGQPFEITWDVANTDLEPVNCQNVDIILSDDGGQNFDVILAQQTPNDGSHTVVVPNNITTQGRIMVRASDNIFFDVSNFNFDINAPTVPSFFIDISERVFELCTPDVVTVDINSDAFLEFSNDVSIDVTSDLPEGSVVTLTESSISADQGTSTLTMDFTNVNATGNYTVLVTGTADGAEARTQEIQVELTSTNFEDLALLGPALESSGVPEVPAFEWTEAINAVSYTIEVSESPAFGETSIINDSGVTGTTYSPTVTLEKNTVYYWRLTAENKCAAFETPIGTFATEALSCKTITTDDLPLNISGSGTPTINSTAFVSGSGQVSDVNIHLIEVFHDNAGDLKISLTAPSGNSVTLVSGECSFTRDVLCGFDDSAALEVTCPISDGNIYRPEQQLSIFNGEDIVGDWIVSVEDTRPGNGGQFRAVQLEVCSNEVLEGPSITNNNTLEVPRDGANRLNPEVLLTEDGNNTADEIEYTILDVPVNGTMTISGEVVVIGSVFTQSDIADGRIRYEHAGGDTTEDTYSFTVNDGEGGWIPTTFATITIGEDFLSSTEDEFAYFAVDVYPNPANDYLTIEINTEVRGDYQMGLFDMTGKQLYSEQLRIDDQMIRHIEATNLPSGMILVKIQNGQENIIKMTSIQH